MTRLCRAASAVVLCLVAGAAQAQTAAPAPSAPPTNLDGKPGSLSDKLGGTDGVIKPTGDIDPAMHRAAPQAGSMPVIEPDAVTPATPK